MYVRALFAESKKTKKRNLGRKGLLSALKRSKLMDKKAQNKGQRAKMNASMKPPVTFRSKTAEHIPLACLKTPRTATKQTKKADPPIVLLLIICTDFLGL
jgi:hypothetical protein